MSPGPGRKEERKVGNEKVLAGARSGRGIYIIWKVVEIKKIPGITVKK